MRITPAQGLWLTVALVAGSIPFCAIGLALGFAAGPNSAPGHISMLTVWTLVGTAAAIAAFRRDEGRLYG